MNLPNLDARLLRVAEFVRNGAYVADIGTDHAYLPVYLVLKGKIAHALASDINEGPVLHAKKTVCKYGVADKIDVVKSDGLASAFQYPVTDIVIAGMGGELIASIIESAPLLKNEKYNLILQPMTHPEILRKYLLTEGFSIRDEDVICDPDDDKIYQIICAEYCINGQKEDDYTEAELLLGRHNIKRESKDFIRLCERVHKTNLHIKSAKESAKQKTEYEENILSFTSRYI